LLGDVQPLAVIALPNSFGELLILGKSGTPGEGDEKKKEKSFFHDLPPCGSWFAGLRSKSQPILYMPQA
jgi:hypothetical protein